MQKQLSSPKAPIVLTLLAALGSICFAVGSGLFLYSNTEKLIAAREWIEHTQQTQLAIERLSRQVERIDTQTRLYAATHDESTLRSAVSAAIALQSGSLRMKNQLADNRNQNQNVEQVQECANHLLGTLTSQSQAAAEIRGETVQCQHSLSLMAGQEGDLLRQRNQASDSRSKLSVVTELMVVLITVVVLLVLFALLVRDIIMRNRIARHREEASAELEESNRDLEASMKTLRQLADEGVLLSAFRDDLQLCTTTDEVYEAACVRFPQIFPETSGAICIINNSRNALESMSTWGESSNQISEVFPPDACCGLRMGQFRFRKPGASEVHCSHFVGKPPMRYACVPLMAQGETLGMVFLRCPTEEVAAQVETRNEALRQLVQLTAITLASIDLRNKLEAQSVRDSLTGLFNRHFMEIALDRELARAARRKNMLAIFMIDVDHFKTFNDRYSHATGDSVLKKVAKVIGASIRTEDVACRYGGEEFTVIVPDTTIEAAHERAERLRTAVEALPAALENGLHTNVTISIGIAIFPNHATSPDHLLRRADEALYRAKHEGRNCVRVADSVAEVVLT
ncbi:diguanylate cyclase [Terriglobus albidus]|uniref:diguanylate cyclase n=1 Tax=Terriglobus albidus TaxID=1592106 RepID=A0A5B9EEF1_9BACT|nr:diguanylate cyclase [Terriglobus albidus]QEE30422.1 diguanylate cyclase [Terriglobus albidus]